MRVAGITIPNEKRLDIGLTVIHGIGRAQAAKVLEATGIDASRKAKDVTEKEEMAIRDLIESTYTIEGDMKRQVSTNVKRLRDIKSYRGMRHARGLPGRGQRTKTNSRTRRGNIRKTMGTGRRKVEKK